MNLFDSSALLAFLLGEPGSDVVESELPHDGACGATGWSETAQKVRQGGGDWPTSRGFLLGYGLRIEAVGAADAEEAAALWRPGSGLSLADRLCLAQGARLQATVWTADTAWGTTAPVRQIR